MSAGRLALYIIHVIALPWIVYPDINNKPVNEAFF